METLGLRELDNTYFEEETNVFYDEINNNLIVFEPHEEGGTVSDVCNGIRDSAYLYLMNELNNNKNIIVYWYQVPGTTSDYIIFYNENVEELQSKTSKFIRKKLFNKLDNDVMNYKYTQFKNGKLQKIENV